MSRIVYVVLSESGEYSDRDVWVGGVYDSIEDAQAAVLKAQERNRAWAEWNRRKYREASRLADATRHPSSGLPQISYEDRWKEAERIVGPMPELEAGERFEIIEAVSGVWDSTVEIVNMVGACNPPQ